MQVHKAVSRQPEGVVLLMLASDFMMLSVNSMVVS